MFTVWSYSLSATIAAFHAPIVLASNSPSGTSPKAGRMRFSTFLRVPYAEAGVLVLPRRPPLGGHVLPEQRPCRLLVEVSGGWELLGAAALDGPLLGQRARLGPEDAGGALPLAFVIADLVADLRVPRGRWDNDDPGHVPCLRVTVG